MSNQTRNVSKKYAKKEFFTIGLVLIIYCLITLYFPVVLNEAVKYLSLPAFLNNFNIEVLIDLLCLIIGTLLPFSLLKLSFKNKNKESIEKEKVPFKEHLINFVVFFAISFALIFTTMMILQYVNIDGQLVSSIGINFNSKYMNDIIYIVSFVLITPILEEYAFRGILLKQLSRYGKYFATIAASLIYALAHGSFLEMVPSFFMGLILSKKALYYKSIKPTIMMHILFNLSLFILIIVPENYSLYVIFSLAFILVIAFILLVTKNYRYVRVKKSNTNNHVGLLFLNTPSVLFALILFILDSLIHIYLDYFL